MILATEQDVSIFKIQNIGKMNEKQKHRETFWRINEKQKHRETFCGETLGIFLVWYDLLWYDLVWYDPMYCDISLTSMIYLL